MKYCLLAGLLWLVLPGFAQQRVPQPPVRLIFDTDIGPDYDDIGAITLLHALADSGQVTILATVASNQHPLIAPVLDVMNTYFGRPDLPVGVVRGRAVNLPARQRWDSLLVARYPHDLRTNEAAEDATTLYRRLLASQPDGSVTICTVGFMTNMANLLESKPDRYSPLDGTALVRQKVRQLVSMAAHFGREMGTFREFNVEKDVLASIYAFDNWPTPILLSGFEIGSRVFTGLPLVASTYEQSPGKDVYARSIPMDKNDVKGRMSWDQTAVLVAIKGYQPYYTVREGRIRINADGSNTWDAAGKGHFYLVEQMPTAQVQQLINDLMLHQPVRKAKSAGR
jgi:inosine-uridine nucleoside N-ribohydrolase